MSCDLHRAFESGDDEAFERAVREADWEDLAGAPWAEHVDDECTFCTAVRAEVRRRTEAPR